ncbi:MAG TPA: glycosyltransferase [Candidatus Dormibacteraeota bacterium]|nr:glycosyltransferase [Candidatus Dormibacteraeota bacterium]
MQVFPHHSLGGTTTMLAMLAREWTALGHDVLCWLPHPTVEPSPHLRYVSDGAFPRHWGPDVVVVHGGILGAVDLGLSPGTTGAPVVEILHRRHPARPGATRYVAVSRAVADVQFEVACRVIPNGVRLPQGGTTRARARAALGIDEDAVVVARHGRIAIEKGWHWTMSVMERVWAAGLPAWLLVVGAGDGPAAAVLRGWARNRRCVLHAWSPSPADQLVAADLYLETSPDEAFGLAVAEAGLLGLPVVAFAAPGVAETLGGACPTVALGDSAAAADLLFTLAHDERGRRRVAERLRRRVAARYAPGRCARRYLELFEEVLAGA